VAGRQGARTHPVGEGDHRVDPDVAVAENARIWRPSRGISGDERVDDPRSEVVLQIERQMRDPERVGDPAGA
jgi:hypothetical protein